MHASSQGASMHPRRAHQELSATSSLNASHTTSSATVQLSALTLRFELASKSTCSVFFGEQQIGFAQSPSVTHSKVDGWSTAEDIAEPALISSGKDSDRTNVVTEGTQLPLARRKVVDWNARVVL